MSQDDTHIPEEEDDPYSDSEHDFHGYPEDDPYEDSHENASVESPVDSPSANPEPSLVERGKDTLSDDKDDPLADSRMSFGDHLEELRSRLIKAIYGLVAGFVICLFLGEEIFGFLAQPLLIALEWSGLEPQLGAISLTEPFVTYVKVSLYAGLFVSCPWVFYQLWVFIAAGLYPRERKYIHRIIPFSAILFLIGGMFFMLVVAPISCSFFIRFTAHYSMPNIKSNPVFEWLLPAMADKEKPQSQTTPEEELSGEAKVLLELLGPCTEKGILTEEQAEEYRQRIRNPEPDPKEGSFVKPWFTLQKYISLILVLGLAFGLAFQMPLVVFFLGRMQFVQLSTFKANRKYVIFALVIASALMTPPDVISQIALVVPMYLLYELGIVLVWIWPPKRIA